jgi:hypothetical protein
MRLQRVAGNRAAAQMVARSRPQSSKRVLARDYLDDLYKYDVEGRNVKNAKAGQFSEASIQRVYDKYGPGTERQRLALAIMSPWVSPQGVWKHVQWDDIAVDAAVRVFDASAFNQASLNVCGTAATLNVAARLDPVGYVSLVRECYDRGRLKDSEFNSELLDTTPQPGMAVVDWMLMSAMQSRANDWYTFAGRPGGHAGTTFKQDRWEMRNYAGAVETDTIDAEDDADVIPATKKVNGLLSSHPTEVEVLISVNSDVVQNSASVAHGHNHVVALTKPATITEDPGGDATKGRVSADLFTWGKILTWTGSVAQWQQMVHEFIVGATRKGLL